MNEQASIPQQQAMLSTKDLVMRTLRDIGCNPYVNEQDDNRIDFHYQGGYFFIATHDKLAFIDLYFAWWYDAPLDDIDALSAIQKAVNKANCKNIGCNVMYTIHQKEGIVRVHSRSQLLFLPDIRYMDLYLTEKLQELLKVRHDVVIAIRTEIAMQ